MKAQFPSKKTPPNMSLTMH